MIKIKNKGFTLIEILVYVIIFSLVFVFMLNTILTVVKIYNRFRITKDLKINAEFSLEKMTREIKLANDIDSSKSVFNSNPGKLYLNSVNQLSGVSEIVEIEVLGNALALKKNNFLIDFFTSSSTEVTNLVFRKIESSTSTKAVKIELELISKRGSEQKSEKFYTTAILKNGY